jgi:hypothetical protein
MGEQSAGVPLACMEYIYLSPARDAIPSDLLLCHPDLLNEYCRSIRCLTCRLQYATFKPSSIIVAFDEEALL